MTAALPYKVECRRPEGFFELIAAFDCFAAADAYAYECASANRGFKYQVKKGRKVPSRRHVPQASREDGVMAIITCDICDKHNVPGSHGQDSTGCDVTQCYVCGGDVFDPYCEMEEASPRSMRAEIEAINADAARIRRIHEELVADLAALPKIEA